MAEFVKVATIEKIPKGKMIKVEAKATEILLANVGGNIYAIDNICSHEGCGLNEGNLDGYIITCPCHAAKYDIRTGNGQKDTPWGSGQQSFKVKIQGKNVLVEF
jgi:3-phenylpropionate/trans-cinnamate dioxygenase ferredoxin subunit